MKGSIYNDDKWTCFAMYPAWAVPATQSLPPDIFPFPLNSTRLVLPSPLPRYLAIQSWIVISSPPQNNALSCLGHKFPPCHLIFSHPLPDALDQPHLARDGQTSPITSSNPIIPSQIPRSPPIFHKGSCFVLPSPRLKTFNSPRFLSPRLTFVSPPLRAPRNSNCRPSMCSRHCQSPSPAHLSRVSSPLHGYLGRTGLNLVSPTVSYSDAHVKMLSGLSRRPLRPLPSSHLIPFRSSRPHIDSRFYSNLATLCFNAFVTTYSVHVLGPSNSSVIQIT